MKQGATAMLLIALLSGCASGSSGYRGNNGLLQWIFQSDASPEETVSEQETAPEQETAAAVTPVSEADREMTAPETGVTDPDSNLNEAHTPVADSETGTADTEIRTREPVIPEPVPDVQTAAPARQASQKPEPSVPETPQPEAQATETAEAATAPAAATGRPSPAAQPEAVQLAQNQHQDTTATASSSAAQEGLSRVVIPYANSPFPHLSPQQHPPLNPREYRQVQQVLSTRQQSGEDTDRYQGEIARARAEGGVMAWFYRLWLQ